MSVGLKVIFVRGYPKSLYCPSLNLTLTILRALPCLSLHLVAVERDEESRPLHLVAGLEPPRPEDGQRFGVVAELPLRSPSKSPPHFETELREHFL